MNLNCLELCRCISAQLKREFCTVAIGSHRLLEQHSSKREGNAALHEGFRILQEDASRKMSPLKTNNRTEIATEHAILLSLSWDTHCVSHRLHVRR